MFSLVLGAALNQGFIILLSGSIGLLIIGAVISGIYSFFDKSKDKLRDQPMKYRTHAEVEADMRKDPNFEGFFKSIDALTAKTVATKKKQDAILKELGFKITFEDVMALLQDEARLKEVVTKLKLKAFW